MKYLITSFLVTVCVAASAQISTSVTKSIHDDDNHCEQSNYNVKSLPARLRTEWSNR